MKKFLQPQIQIFVLTPTVKAKKKANIRNRCDQVPRLTRTPYGKVTKPQENITHKRAKTADKEQTRQYNKDI